MSQVVEHLQLIEEKQCDLSDVGQTAHDELVQAVLGLCEILGHHGPENVELIEPIVANFLPAVCATVAHLCLAYCPPVKGWTLKLLLANRTCRHVCLTLRLWGFFTSRPETCGLPQSPFFMAHSAPPLRQPAATAQYPAAGMRRDVLRARSL
jgi:hypothetical protein